MIIAGTGLILAAGLILKGRKNQAARNARYRAPRPALKLDRASAGQGRSGGPSPLLAKARQSSSPAAPIMLGVVLLVLSLWLAAAYLRPSAELAQAGTATVQPSSPPTLTAQVGTLAGRLSAAPDSPANGTAGPNQAPTSAPPENPSSPAVGARAAGLAQAAAAQAEALSQVGLLPTNRPAAAPKPTSEPANRPAAKAETKPAAVAPPAPAVIDRPPPPPIPVSANSNLVRAVAEPLPGGTGAPANTGGRSGILSNTEGFTVHLGSFVDQANAEKYRAKLAAAGEEVFISEISLDGRRWYRVLTGRFDTRAAADAHGRDLRRRGLTEDTGGPFIVKPINSSN